jgi:hypothetical protein
MMKKIILSAIITLSVGRAWAGDYSCKVYEYSEIKDMTDVELKQAIDAAQKRELSNMEYKNKMSELSAYREAKLAGEDVTACGNQIDRLWSAQTKRASYVAPPKMTYEGCLDMVKQLNQPPKFCDDKFKK